MRQIPTTEWPGQSTDVSGRTVDSQSHSRNSQIARCLAALLILGVWLPSLLDAQPLMRTEEYLKQGIRDYQQGDFDGAIRLLGIAIIRGFEDTHAFTQAHLYLGLSYIAFGKMNEAENAFTRIVERDPSFTMDAERYPPKAVNLFDKVRGALVSGWTIRTNPSGVEIWSQEELLGTSDEASGEFRREPQLVGRYTLRFHKRHYRDATMQVEAVPGSVRQYEVTLERKMLRLHISGGPGEVAVSADGEHVGTLPQTITRPSGSAMQLICSRPYYRSQQFKVQFDEDRVLINGKAIPVVAELASLRVALEPQPPGALQVVTEPEGATLLLDGDLHGQTPVALESVAAGPHHLEIYLDGYQTVKEDILIMSGQEHALHYLLGTVLDIETFPAGATLRLGERLLGQSPLQTEPLPQGKFVLYASHPGFFPVRHEVRIDEKGVRDLTLSLVPQTGGLSLHSSPPAAQVLLDGKMRGKTPLLLLHLPVSEHTLEIQREGYAPYRTQVEVRLQEIRWQTFDLKPVTGN